MTAALPVAVTGANGRLGRALVEYLNARGMPVLSWTRPDYDLDDQDAPSRLISRDQPATVIHPAAWTDVDGCARDPVLARQRNELAVEALAIRCAEANIGLVLVSTNEVFDGERLDGLGYVESDTVRPINPYGESKLAGEQRAREAYLRAGSDRLWIVRTSWLYGPPGNDFPTKIIAGADRLPAGTPLRVVSDEIGSPTYTPDLAAAIVELFGAAPPNVYHLANEGRASRFEIASDVLARCRPGTPIEPISQNEFVRPSRPPAWSVLDGSRAASFGVRLRPWQEALADYLGEIC